MKTFLKDHLIYLLAAGMGIVLAGEDYDDNVVMMKTKFDVRKYSNFAFLRRDHGHALLALSVLRPQED